MNTVNHSSVIPVAMLNFAGHVGLYVDLETATPLDDKANGSHVYFMRELFDKFTAHMQTIALEVLKGVFERRELLAGAIFEEYQGTFVTRIMQLANTQRRLGFQLSLEAAC